MCDLFKQRLNEITLRFDIKDAAPSFYLTLISIIASMAFAYLLTNIKVKFLYGDEWQIGYWFQVITAMQAIIVIWHEYALGAAAFKWVLTYIDSTIPFMFGISLFGLIYSIEAELEKKWLYFLAFYCFLGALAMWNQYLKAKREPENKNNLKVLKKLLFTNIFYSLFCTILFFLLAIVREKLITCYNYYQYLGGVSCVIFIFFTILQHKCWSMAFKKVKPK